MSRSSPASTVTCAQMCGVLIGPSRQNSPLSIGRIAGGGREAPARRCARSRGHSRCCRCRNGRRSGAGRACRGHLGATAARAEQVPAQLQHAQAGGLRQASITCRSGTPQRRASGRGLIRSASTSAPRRPALPGARRGRARRGRRPAAGPASSRRARAAPVPAPSAARRDRPLAAREAVGLRRQAQEHALGRAQEAAGEDARPSSPLGADSRR